MIVLALLLLIAAAALVVFIVVTGSTGEIPLEWDDMNIAFSPSPLVLFLLGAFTLLLAVLALGLLKAGTKRSTEKRRELKKLRRLQDERETQPRDGEPETPRESVGGRGDAGYRAKPDGPHLGKGAPATGPQHAAPQPSPQPQFQPGQPHQPGVQPAPPAPGTGDPGATTYDPR